MRSRFVRHRIPRSAVEREPRVTPELLLAALAHGTACPEGSAGSQGIGGTHFFASPLLAGRSALVPPAVQLVAPSRLRERTAEQSATPRETTIIAAAPDAFRGE